MPLLIVLCGWFIQRPRLPSRAAGRGDARGHPVRAVERAHRGGVAGAVGGHAGLVRGRLPRQRQVRRHHVRALRPGDPAGDRSVLTARDIQNTSSVSVTEWLSLKYHLIATRR